MVTLLDTTLLVDLMKKKTSAMKIMNNLKNERFCSTIINYYEMVVGSNLKKHLNKNEINQINNLFSDLDDVLLMDRASALNSAAISSELVKKGLKVNDNDCFIIGIMKSHRINSIITRDKRHFSRIKGIKVIDY